mmetsp:Transcript_6826/g.20262  ORF Transcript_6826/g.20262 Transcript_6826/m.20262 type:complete len:148 (+) Transcript_6826:83-526(+)
MPDEAGPARLVLEVLGGELMVARLLPDAIAPAWALESHPPLTSLCRTSEELSLIAPAALAGTIADATVEAGWRAIKVVGPLDFSLVGILADLAGVLARAKVSIFALSTFYTDYILVKEGTLAAAKAALRGAGYTVQEHGDGALQKTP